MARDAEAAARDFGIPISEHLAETLDTDRGRSPAPPARNDHDLAFPDAIQCVIEGERIRRRSWPDPSVIVWLTDGRLKIRLGSGELADLILSDGDLTADDWVVVRTE